MTKDFQEGGSGKCEEMKTTSLQLPLITWKDIHWEYSMRRDMQEIVPGVFLGPYSSVMKTKLTDLIEHGITSIICVRHSLESQFIRPNFQDHFVYLILDIADSCMENIIKHFSLVKNFINETLERGGKVLIHGNGGISRSAALVLAYIMEKYGITLKEALIYAQQRRLCINPNEGFLAQLNEFEVIYKAQKIFQNGFPLYGNTPQNKRHWEE